MWLICGSVDTRRASEAVQEFRPPAFPLRGDDVIKLGRKPGPDIGRVLELIEEWWVDEDFKPDREACLERLKLEIS